MTLARSLRGMISPKENLSTTRIIAATNNNHHRIMAVPVHAPEGLRPPGACTSACGGILRFRSQSSCRRCGLVDRSAPPGHRHYPRLAVAARSSGRPVHDVGSTAGPQRSAVPFCRVRSTLSCSRDAAPPLRSRLRVPYATRTPPAWAGSIAFEASARQLAAAARSDARSSGTVLVTGRGTPRPDSTRAAGVQVRQAARPCFFQKKKTRLVS